MQARTVFFKDLENKRDHNYCNTASQTQQAKHSKPNAAILFKGHVHGILPFGNNSVWQQLFLHQIAVWQLIIQYLDDAFKIIFYW